MHFRHERTTMTSGDIGKSDFRTVLPQPILSNANLSRAVVILSLQASLSSLQPYSDDANGSMKNDPSSSLLHVSKLLLTMTTAMEIYANPCVALTTRSNSPCIFKTKASRITNPYSYINFPPLCNI